MKRLVHFEIHAEDMDRAAKFYSAVFGWQFKKWDGPIDYMVITTGPEGTPGINGGLVKRKGPVPTDGAAVNAFVCTMDVDSVDQTLEAVIKNGGTIALEKMAMAGMAWLAYAKDPEGNIFGIIQDDKEAR